MMLSMLRDSGKAQEAQGRFKHLRAKLKGNAAETAADFIGLKIAQWSIKKKAKVFAAHEL